MNISNNRGNNRVRRNQTSMFKYKQNCQISFSIFVTTVTFIGYSEINIGKILYFKLIFKLINNYRSNLSIKCIFRVLFPIYR